ncbi:MAG TPA: metallophosphoesterase [Blastocatellia bacterium]|nr:metallophosphoesterase [Blastocatellia bacterium]
MRIFAIGDMHLAGGTDKTMDRFGEHWRDHDRKIFDAWERLAQDDDLLLIAGDTSWAMRLNEALPDLGRIGRMRGRKLMIKGNHDYWWDSLAKLRRAVDPSIDFLQASAIIVNRVAIAGTRGWNCPGDSVLSEQDQKLYEREVGRLRAALQSLIGRANEYDRLIVVLHYPPTNDRHEPSGFTELIDEFNADACVYGHLHGEFIKTGLIGLRQRTFYYLVSADAVSFTPLEIPVTRQSPA